MYSLAIIVLKNNNNDNAYYNIEINTFFFEVKALKLFIFYRKKFFIDGISMQIVWQIMIAKVSQKY